MATAASGEGLDIARDDDQTKTARELEPVTFNLTLKYTGAQTSAIVEVHLFDIPQGWSHRIEGTSKVGQVDSDDFIRLRMDQGETARAMVTVTPGEGCRGGLYILTVYTSVEGEISLHDTVAIHVGVPDVYQHTARLVELPMEGYFGYGAGYVLFWVEIENTGNMDDAYEVQARFVGNEDLWRASPVAGVDADGVTPTILHGTSHVVTFLANILLTTSTTHETWVNVTVLPEKGSLDTSTELRGRIQATINHELPTEIEGGRLWELDPSEGSRIDTTLNVWNQWGFGDVFVETEKAFTGPSVGLTVEVNPASREIPVGESVQIEVSIVLPGDCLAGTYIVQLGLFSEGANGGTRVDLEVRVLQTREVVVDPEECELFIDLGYTPRLWFNVTNKGNAPTMVYIWPFTVPLGWNVYLNPPRMHLPSGATAISEFAVILPTKSEPGPRGPIELQFRVEEMNGDNEMITIQVYIPGWYQFEWMGEDGPITGPEFTVAPVNTVHEGIRHMPSEPLDMTFSVAFRNLGPVSATAELGASVDSDHIEVHFERDSLFVAGRKIAYATLVLYVDRQIEMGTYTVDLTLGALEAPDRDTRNASFTIEVFTIDVGVSIYNVVGLEHYDPTCSTSPMFIYVNETLGFDFRIEDLGSESARHVVVELTLRNDDMGSGINDKWTLQPTHGGVYEYSHEWIAKGKGWSYFTVTIEVDGPQMNTKNDAASLTFDVLVNSNGNGGNGGGGDPGGNGGSGDPGGNGGSGGSGSGDDGGGDVPFHVYVSRTGLAILVVTVVVFTSVGLWRYRQTDHGP